MRNYKLAASNVDGVYQVKRFDPAITVYLDDAFEDALATLEDGEIIHASYNQQQIDQLSESYSIEYLDGDQ